MYVAWGSWVGVTRYKKANSQSWWFKSPVRPNGGRWGSVDCPQCLGMINSNNHPSGKDVSVLIVVAMAAVLVMLSSMERPVKHEHFNFSVLRQGFKNYSRNQKFLVSILSLARQILSRAPNLLLRIKYSYIQDIQWCHTSGKCQDFTVVHDGIVDSLSSANSLQDEIFAQDNYFKTLVCLRQKTQKWKIYLRKKN